ncbi:hypothetical protein scyTo_0007949 [Scyliorhinus torazame]|uniref:BHLH domain-containing protein n=1 Tax=Scyliorhinus torazame TaxID=75743 RepID=A0A401P150_SCYTO|nr:hypothetical protein [Scyliorhinus torazame]
MSPHLYESSTTEHGQYSAHLNKRKKREASELRKTQKPLMEKRRRARINDSLNQLKTLILPLIGKDSPRYSKLEKADILEMTVRFLQDLPQTPLYDRLDSYRDGYRACLLQLSNLLPSSKLMGTEGCDRLTDYLRRCMPLVSHYPYSARSPPGAEQGSINYKPISHFIPWVKLSTTLWDADTAHESTGYKLSLLYHLNIYMHETNPQMFLHRLEAL